MLKNEGKYKRLIPPLSDADVVALKIGDKILISGIIYGARDSAHKRMIESIKKGERLPIDVKGQVIYYVGPSPAKPGSVIGSAGPTTSGRMDSYAPLLIERGLKGMIGKGLRSKEVIDACIKFKAVYLGAVGGAGAYISKRIKASRIVAYEELGPEAVYEFKVEDFPVIVINDVKGNDLYKTGMQKYSTLRIAADKIVSLY